MRLIMWCMFKVRMQRIVSQGRAIRAGWILQRRWLRGAGRAALTRQDDDAWINDDEAEELELKSKQRDEMTNYVKGALDPAWTHGRKRVYTLPPEAAERVEQLSRLISGRQARHHAANVLGKTTGKQRRNRLAELEVEREKSAGPKGKIGDDEERDEDNEGGDDEDEEIENTRGKGAKAGRQGEDDGGMEGLSERRRKAREGYTPGEALTYLTRTVLSNYSITQRVLGEAFDAPGASGLPEPKSILDFGSGPGTGLLAAHTLWPELERVEGVERSEEMQDLSKLMLQHIEPRRLVFHRDLPTLAEQVRRTGCKYDVVLSSYTLTELESEAAMAAAAQLLWELVAPNGVLALIEAGNPIGSHVVRSARKMVLTTKKGGPRGTPAPVEAHTVGPCPHDHPCPLQREEWCSFQQRVQGPSLLSARGRSGGKNFRDVSFSYVVMRKSAPHVADPESWSRYSALSALRHRKTDDVELDWEALEEQPLLRGEWARLIRTPKKGKGRVVLDVCTPDGHIEQVTVARSGSKALPGKLLGARKAEWGGLWPYPEI